MSVNVGDKITVVLKWQDRGMRACGSGDLLHTTINEVCCPRTYANGASYQAFAWLGGMLYVAGTATVAVEQDVGELFVEDEGRTWVRGWLPLDSPEVQALLTVHTLVDDLGAAPTKLFTEEDSDYTFDVGTFGFDDYLDDRFEARGLVR